MSTQLSSSESLKDLVKMVFKDCAVWVDADPVALQWYIRVENQGGYHMGFYITKQEMFYGSEHALMVLKHYKAKFDDSIGEGGYNQGLTQPMYGAGHDMPNPKSKPAKSLKVPYKVKKVEPATWESLYDDKDLKLSKLKKEDTKEKEPNVFTTPASTEAFWKTVPGSYNYNSGLSSKDLESYQKYLGERYAKLEKLNLKYLYGITE